MEQEVVKFERIAQRITEFQSRGGEPHHRDGVIDSALQNYQEMFKDLSPTIAYGAD